MTEAGSTLDIPTVAGQLSDMCDEALSKAPSYGPDDPPVTMEVPVWLIRQFAGAAAFAWKHNQDARFAIGDYVSTLGNKYEGETRDETEARQLKTLTAFAAYRPPCSDNDPRGED